MPIKEIQTQIGRLGTRITYYLLYTFVYLLSLLPFKCLYLLADIMFILVFHIVRYRRQVVSKNLSSSFPQKSEAELHIIERQFYHWFCDYIFETFKLLTINDKQLRDHIEFRNIEEVEAHFKQGQNCSAFLGHYCNWEWLSATSLAFLHYPEAVTGLIYHPLYNKVFDRLFIEIRRAHRGTCIPKKDILRHIVSLKREQRPYLFGYISDQAPKWENMHLWLDFLNHDTAVFTGGERIMRKMNDAVFYIDMQRPKRGKYVCTFRLISANAAKEEEFHVTKVFFRLLEESIHRQPAFYLWTHNRWKRSHEEFNRRFNVINGKIIRKEESK